MARRTRRSRGKQPPVDWLARGGEAMEAYDYPQARNCFQRALRQDPASVQAARALVELLVDYLAADEDAVGLADTLSASTRQDETVRGCLALAAARTHRSDLALELLPPRGERRAEVLAVLVRAALKAGDLDHAARWIVRLEEADRWHASLRGFQDRLQEARARQRQPAETALGAMVEAQDWEAVDAAARELVRRWPDSAPARRALAQVERHRRQQRVQELERKLSRELERQDLPRAERLLREWREAGGADRRLQQRVQALREQVEARERQQRVEDLQARFQRGERPWLRYLSSPEETRQALRQRVPSRELGWLEELGAPLSGSRARDAVAAVRALSVARAELEAGDALAALAAVEPFERVLKGVADARALRQQARDTIRQVQLGNFLRVMEEARRALGAGRPEDAAAVLDRLSSGDASLQERQDYDALRQRVDAALERERWSASAQALAAKQDWLGLQDHCDDGRWRGWEIPASLAQHIEDLPRRIQIGRASCRERV